MSQTLTPRQSTARRLELLAVILRDRAHHAERWQVERLVALAEEAAMATVTATRLDGQDLPTDAVLTIQELIDRLSGQDFHIPPAIVGYAVAPALGELPEMSPLRTVSKQLASQDVDLRARRDAVLRDGHLGSEDDEIVAWALRALVVLHRKHDRLAAAVAIDNERPDNGGKAPVDGS
jgi:hypothetical protein